MILQHLIKREFSPQAWTAGTVTFRDNRVTSVKFKHPNVSAIVTDRVRGNPPQKVSFELHRDGMENAKCACGHTKSESRCEHIAALVIWWMARGSLLRAGVSTLEAEETANKAQSANARGTKSSPIRPFLTKRFSAKLTSEDAADEEIEVEEERKPIHATAVTYVHFVQRDDDMLGICLEPALKYTIPAETTKTKGKSNAKNVVEVVRSLRPEGHPKMWRNLDGFTLEIFSEDIPVLQNVYNTRLTYMGQAGIQMLGRLFSTENMNQVALDPALDLEYVEEPLKLTQVKIGAKIGQKRSLSFRFSNGKQTITSDELQTLAAVGRLSPEYVWRGKQLLRFETPLSSLARHINRSGLNILESIGMKPMEGLSELDDSGESPLHPLAVMRLSLELGVEDFEVDPNWTEYHEWKNNFEKKSCPTLPRINYGFDLRDYQRNGLNWIWSLYHRGLSAFLADDMGLGKTHQVLAFLSSIYRSKKYKPEYPSIVVAPTSVVAAWKQKLERYPTGLKWLIYHGSARELPQNINDVNIVITTYGILQRDMVLREIQWHAAIIDESQAIKNANTMTSRISRALKAKFRIAMTGTPVENSSADLWSILEFLLPGYMGSQARFKRLYCSKNDSLSPEKTKMVKKLVTPFLLRRTKSQVLKELPEKTEEVILCEMTPYQKGIYNSYLRSQEVNRMREELSEEGRKVDFSGILALLTKLKQVCDHPQLPELTASRTEEEVAATDPYLSGKWEALEEIVAEAIGSNLKVVVFTQFLAQIDLLKAWLVKQGVGYAELRGDTRDRSGVIERFKDNPQCKVFICSLMAGGLGIDLTAASVCIHYDRWWNPARENQATDRLHRIGQTRGVQVFKFQCPNTVEDRIASIIERKVALSGALIEDSSLGLKSFSRHELLELLQELAGAE